MSAQKTSTKPRTFNPSKLPQPPPTYDHVAVTPLLPTSKLVTLAGQVGIDPATKNPANTFTEQVKFAYDNVENALEAAGATPRDIIHVRHYIVEDSGDVELNKKAIYDRGFAPLWIKFMDTKADGHRPPDTVLGVASLAEKTLLYEIEAWAIIHS